MDSTELSELERKARLCHLTLQPFAAQFLAASVLANPTGNAVKFRPTGKVEVDWHYLRQAWLIWEGYNIE